MALTYSCVVWAKQKSREKLRKRFPEVSESVSLSFLMTKLGLRVLG